MQNSSNSASHPPSRPVSPYPSPLGDSSSSALYTRDSSAAIDTRDSSSSSAIDTRDFSSLPVDSDNDPGRRDSGSTDNNQGGFFHHITYPVSYTLSGLLRRLSVDEAPTPLARALSANYSGAMPSLTSAFDAPKRRLSPFQPPPLTPLTLTGYRDSTSFSSRLLENALAEEIRLLMPPRVQLVDEWRLVYSLEQNGTSLGSLYSLSEEYRGKRGGFVLVVRDASQGVSHSPLLMESSFQSNTFYRPLVHTSPIPLSRIPTTTAPASAFCGAPSVCRRCLISPCYLLRRLPIPLTCNAAQQLAAL
jgi:hypothetical protein